MKVHELVDWLEKHADPEGTVFVEASGDGALHGGPARQVIERTKLHEYPEYIVTTEAI